MAAFSVGCNSSPKPAPEVKSAPAPAAPKLPEDKRPVVVAFGDSITAGFGVEPGKSFPDDLQRLIDKDGLAFHVVNLGVSGDTTADGVERLPVVVAMHPKVAIVEFGGNDGLRGLPVDAAKVNLALIIQGLQNEGITVLLAGMTLPRNYGAQYIGSFDKIYPELAKQFKVPLIPFILDGVGGHPDLTQADGLHPTAEGAQIVAANVMNYLKPILLRARKS